MRIEHMMALPSNIRAELFRTGFSGIYAYVGRLRGYRSEQHFGNPFSHLTPTPGGVEFSETRAQACSDYEQWLDGTDFTDIDPGRRLWILDNIYKLDGKILVCWCVPKQCHATGLGKRVIAMLRGES